MPKSPTVSALGTFLPVDTCDTRMGAVTITVDVVVGVVLSVVASVVGASVVVVVVVVVVVFNGFGTIWGVFEKEFSMVSLTLKFRVPDEAVAKMASLRLRCGVVMRK